MRRSRQPDRRAGDQEQPADDNRRNALQTRGHSPLVGPPDRSALFQPAHKRGQGQADQEPCYGTNTAYFSMFEVRLLVALIAGSSTSSTGAAPFCSNVV